LALQGFNPTSIIIGPELIEDFLRNIMRIPSLLYGTGVSHTYTLFLGTTHGLSAMYYATGEKYFDFLTRDGLWKTAPRTLYFDPFELTIWIAVLATSFCLILILVAT
jgi:hypothetical protein